MKIIQSYLQEESEESEDTKTAVKCIIKNNKYILLLRRANDAAGGGMWDLPGGHLQEDEKEEDGLDREIDEETKLKIKTPTHVKDVDMPDGTTCKIYKAKVEGEGTAVTMQTSDSNLDPFVWQNMPRPEHTELKWVRFKDELERMPMHKLLKPIVLKSLEDRKT